MRPPIECRSEKAMRELQRDNVCVGDFIIQLDPRVVWLGEHAKGEKKSRQHFSIPRRTFDKFVKWYTTGKVPREDAKSR